jgi:hypothetical protein
MSIKLNIDDIEVEAKKLQTAINLAYKTNVGLTEIFTSDKSDNPLVINEVDVFYNSDPSNLEYMAETTLHVYVKSDKKTIDDVYEVLHVKRYKGQYKGNSTWYDGTLKPVYLKHKLKYSETSKGKIVYKHNTTEVKILPTGQYYEIKVRFICVKEDAYRLEGEDRNFEGVPHKRRGLWFYRGIRCVGKCIELGSSLNDECNRQRMEITYPADLDYSMGMRIQKQMGTITSTSVSDALIIIWEQQNREIIRLKMKERKALKLDYSDSNSNCDSIYDDMTDDNDDNSYSKLSPFIPNKEPTIIIKTKRPIVAPLLPVAIPDSPVAIPDSPVAIPDSPVTIPDSPVAIPDSPVAVTPVILPEIQSTCNIQLIKEDTRKEDDKANDTEEVNNEEIIKDNQNNEKYTKPNIIIMPVLDTNDSINNNKTIVGSYTRNSPKSEKDAFNSIFNLINKSKFQEKSTNPSHVTDPVYTQLCMYLELFSYKLDN